MDIFAKLFTHPTMGQILVTIGQSADHEHAEVRYHYQPSGLGVCSSALQWPDDGKWEAAEEHFAAVTEESAAAFVAPHFKMASTFAA